MDTRSARGGSGGDEAGAGQRSGRRAGLEARVSREPDLEQEAAPGQQIQLRPAWELAVPVGQGQCEVRVAWLRSRARPAHVAARDIWGATLRGPRGLLLIAQ